MEKKGSMKPKPESEAAVKFGIFCAQTALTVAAVLSQGWALSLLWKWFVCPLGIPPIGIAWAIGLGLVSALFHAQPHHKTKNYLKDATMLALGAPIMVGFGWVVHLWL